MKSANQRRQSNSSIPVPSRRRRRVTHSGTHPTGRAPSSRPPPPPVERRVSEEPAVEPRALRSELLVAALLSAVAGFVDAAGFLALFGMFTAHVTGDLVAAGAVVAEHTHFGLLARLAMIPVFMGSVAATALFARSIRRRGHRPLVALLALMTVGLLVFCITGVALHRFANTP